VREGQLQDISKEQVGLAAAWLPRADLAALKGVPADVGAPAYHRLKLLLQDLVKVRPGTRFAYLMALRGTLPIFLVDAEPEGSPDFSPPGQVYTEATPILMDTFSSPEPLLDGPARVTENKTGSVSPALSR